MLYRHISTTELFGEFQDMMTASYIRQQTFGKIVLILAGYIRSRSKIADLEQIVLTETLAECLRQDYTYTVCSPKYSQITKSMKDALERQGFIPVPLPEVPREIFVVDMKQPVVLYHNVQTAIKEPFSTGIFTATSHHPFNIPDRYRSVFPEGSLPIHKCIRYTDHALKHFFETASKEKWFENTLFVFTADHTNQNEHPIYQNEAGLFSVPIIFYTPDGSLQGKSDAIAQQIDIMPTVLGYLGYDNPYIAFGCDLLHTPKEDTYAVNYLNGVYQFFKGEYMIQFDGNRTTAVYAFRNDPLLKTNLINISLYSKHSSRTRNQLPSGFSISVKGESFQ